MSHPRIVEDRVFGQEKALPEQGLLSHASTAYDLFSCSVEGADVAYAHQGTVNHPPLLFLHGWGASHKYWLHTFSGFAPRWRCVAPDFPGFGLSAKPERDYSLEALATWVGRFLDRLGFPRVTLVGHSMGGAVALNFALANPARVEKLVLVNPLVRGSDGLSSRCRLLMAPGVRQLLFWLRRNRGLRRWISQEFTSASPLQDALVDDILAPTYRAMVDTFRSLSATDLAGRAPAMPALAIGTDLDQVLDPGQIDLLPFPRQRIDRAGHIPMVEQPAAFNRALDHFLRATT
jgi:pimeloyl-ACP methyl ester carboxylesterase